MEVWQVDWEGFTEGQGLFSWKIQTFSQNQQRSATTSQISHKYLYISHVTPPHANKSLMQWHQRKNFNTPLVQDVH